MFNNYNHDTSILNLHCQLIGEAAGLLRIKLLREPEAAALAYGLTQRYVTVEIECSVDIAKIIIFSPEDERFV